jgi:hypothetical protein
MAIRTPGGIRLHVAHVLLLLFPTIEGLFDVMASANARNAAGLDASYDGSLGYPTSISVTLFPAHSRVLAGSVADSYAKRDIARRRVRHGCAGAHRRIA